MITKSPQAELSLLRRQLALVDRESNHGESIIIVIVMIITIEIIVIIVFVILVTIEIIVINPKSYPR